MAALAVLASALCLATPVHGSVVRSGPIRGYVTTGFDVVHGRFALHVGPWRVRGTLTQKIPWFVDEGVVTEPALRVSAVRLAPKPARTFTATLTRAGMPDNVFPSIISPPAPGCWRLTLQSGDATGVFVALVRR